jgi:hypothetical protein
VGKGRRAGAVGVRNGAQLGRKQEKGGMEAESGKPSLRLCATVVDEVTEGW